MKFACDIQSISHAFVYFDRPICRDFETADYDVADLVNKPVSISISKILGIYGILAISIRKNIICIERYDHEISFDALCLKVAYIVSEYRVCGAPEPSQMTLEEFKDQFPGMIHVYDLPDE